MTGAEQVLEIERCMENCTTWDSFSARMALAGIQPPAISVFLLRQHFIMFRGMKEAAEKLELEKTPKAD